MMVRLVYIGFILLVTRVVYSQDLASELPSLQTRYQASTEVLEKQKAEMMSQASQPYLSALASVEKDATEKGDLDLVAACMNERSATMKGMLELEMPASLPKFRLNMIRSTLIKNLEKLETDFRKRRKQIDVEYLRMLSLLEKKAGMDAELSKQVVKEKEMVLLRNSVNDQDSKKTTEVGKNIVKNGSFDKSENKNPEGWTSSSACLIIREVGNSFARLQVASPANDGLAPASYLEQTISIPKGATQVKISGRVRTKNCIEVKDKGPYIALRYTGNNGKGYFYSTKWNKPNDSWHTVQSEVKLENPTQTGVLFLHNGYLAGQIDFDDIVVTFK